MRNPGETLREFLDLCGYTEEEYRQDMRGFGGDGPVFGVLPDGTAALIAYEGDGETYDVPAEYAGAPVTVIARRAFAHRDELLADGEKYLRSVCQNLGVDMRKMDSERRRKKVASILAEDLKEAEDMKIEGTPYFLVNNLVIRGAVSKDLFRRAIEIELNRVK